jgi:lipopolysaccharide/colanic/teichoic acid biosynthesis glycosyltransferase
LAFAAFAVALIPLAPLLALERAGSIFVHERRVGRFGRPFTMLRFRTARKASGEPHWPFADPAAPTRIGAVIGRLGIDRLPQSLAILSGHLSLVGPRPMDVEAQQRIAQALPVFLARSAIKPGLTGWEQMHHESRSNLDLLRQLEYDLYYVKYQSAALDICILWRRALAVAGLRRGGN